MPPTFTLCIRESIKVGQLVSAPIRDVFWTPSVETKLHAAPKRGQSSVVLGRGDYIVGTYASLRAAREFFRVGNRSVWQGTDIHHIVENQHLQFCATAGIVSDHSYENLEPCVVMTDVRHRLLIENLIGNAVRLECEAAGTNPFARYDAERAKKSESGSGKKSRGERARERAGWVNTQPAGTREQIGKMLVKVYSTAYHLDDERPLLRVALGTLKEFSA